LRGRKSVSRPITRCFTLPNPVCIFSLVLPERIQDSPSARPSFLLQFLLPCRCRSVRVAFKKGFQSKSINLLFDDTSLQLPRGWNGTVGKISAGVISVSSLVFFCRPPSPATPQELPHFSVLKLERGKRVNDSVSLASFVFVFLGWALSSPRFALFIV